ncbi:hypothetical protein ACIBI9_67880 [Nonomuraea sp. NPDC050451]|uniref:hypothetical protein n=1 Tax=Nonomuraea sp. NPDC050451 TaxID=3364364 RepID=UPI0037B67B5A
MICGTVLAARTDVKVAVQAMLGYAIIVLTADTYVSVAHEAAKETSRLVLSTTSALGRELSAWLSFAHICPMPPQHANATWVFRR